MSVRSRLLAGVVGAAALALGLAVEASALFAELAATRDTIAALRQGGFVLYLVEGSTDQTRADRLPGADPSECAAQRPLTTEGRHQMVRVGEALRRARIPVGEVRVSPACRSVDAAEAAFGREYVVDERLLYVAAMTTDAKQPLLATLRRWLSAAVAGGTNRLLLGQPQPLVDLLGYFPAPGTLVVFKPAEGKRFEYVASIATGHWGVVTP